MGSVISFDQVMQMVQDVPTILQVLKGKKFYFYPAVFSPHRNSYRNRTVWCTLTELCWTLIFWIIHQTSRTLAVWVCANHVTDHGKEMFFQYEAAAAHLRGHQLVSPALLPHEHNEWCCYLVTLSVRSMPWELKVRWKLCSGQVFE